MSEKPSTNDNEQLTHTHLAAGYANSQEIIRFLDTKAGALIGLVTIALSLPILLFQWILDKQSQDALCFSALKSSHPIQFNLIAGILLIGLLAGAASLWCAIEVTIARPHSHKWQLFPFTVDWQKLELLAKKQEITGDILSFWRSPRSRKRRATLLFPLGNSYLDRKYITKKATQGINQQEINREHGQQLLRIGSILGKKITYMRYGAKYFQAQIVLYAIAAIICYVAYAIA